MLRRTALLSPLLAAGAFAQNAPPKTHLKVGDKLSEQRGKTVVLAFFPAAFTGG